MLQNLPETNNRGQYLVRHAKYLAIIGVIWALSATGQIVGEIVITNSPLDITLPAQPKCPDPINLPSFCPSINYSYNALDIERVIHPEMGQVTKQSYRYFR